MSHGLPETTSGRSLIDRDKLMNADRSKVADLTVRLFDLIQDQPTHERALALAAAFVLLSRAARVDYNDVMTAVSNLIVDPITSTGYEKRFGAMLFHLEEDIIDRSRV